MTPSRSSIATGKCIWLPKLIQRQISSFLTVGAEVFHATPNEVDGDSSTGFNAGWIVDFNEMNHLLFSAGHSM